MSDATDVMAVLGAIDHEVARLDGDARAAAHARVAELIPPYAEPEVVGWYDRLVDAGGGAGPPELDRALERLARPPGDDNALPLRVAALGAAARAFPETYGPEGSKREAVLRALAVPGILAPAGDLAAGDAEQGLRVLAAPPAGDRSFSGLRGAGPPALADPLFRKPGPFFGKLPPDGGIDLRARLRVRGLTLDDARHGMLDPARWKLVDGWCDMVPSAAPPPEPGVEQRFLEVVAMGNCEGSGLKLAVWLDFFPIEELVDHTGVELTLGYTMSPEQPSPANDRVVKDEGEVSVFDEGDHLTVRTRKVLKAAIPGLKSVPSLAYSLGYLDLAARFIVQTSSGLGNEITIEEDA